MITIITDGSADNITRKGAWCAIVRTSTHLEELTGFEDDTTSNRMELTAAIEGLRAVQTPSKITLVSDSAYLLNTLKREWYVTWLKDEMRGVRTKPRPNMDLWKQLIGLTQFHDVQFVKVKGHSGDYWNERADRLADYARVHRVSSRNVVSGYVDGSRCDSLSRSGKQCKLHFGHTGDHRYRLQVGEVVMNYGTLSSA